MTGAIVGMLTLYVKGIVLLLLAGAFGVVLRRASAATRHLVLELGMAGLLLLALGTAIVPSWQMEVLTADARWSAGVDALLWPYQDDNGVAATPEGGRGTGPAEAEIGARDGSVAGTTRGDAGPWAPFTLLPGAVLLLWAMGAWILLFRTCGTLLRLRRLRRAASSLTGTAMGELCDALARRVGVRRGVRVGVHGSVTVPMTLGTWRPTVLLPETAPGWSTDRLRVVFLHELAHVRRMDALRHVVAEVACAVHWCNPLVWPIRRRLLLERERACDEAVMRAGVGARRYAQHLVGVARSMLRTDGAALDAVAMARPTELRRRVTSIMDGRRREPMGCATTLGIRLTTCSAVVLLAAAQLGYRPAGPPVSQVTRGAQPAEQVAPPASAPPATTPLRDETQETVATPSSRAGADPAAKARNGRVERLLQTMTVATHLAQAERLQNVLTATAAIPDDSLRAVATMRLSDVPSRRAAVWLAGRAFDDPSEHVRNTALQALVLHRINRFNPRVRPMLEAIVQDEDVPMRYRVDALLLMATSDEPDAVEMMQGLARTVQHPGLRRLASRLAGNTDLETLTMALATEMAATQAADRETVAVAASLLAEPSRYRRPQRDDRSAL